MENKFKGESAADMREELKGVASGIKDEVVEAADEAKTKGVDEAAGVIRAVQGAADAAKPIGSRGAKMADTVGAAQRQQRTSIVIDTSNINAVSLRGE